MPFLFQCPTGHLLEADESQVGQQSQCPMCGQTFAIPAPSGVAPAPPSEINPFAVSPPAPGGAVEPAPLVMEQGGASFDPTGELSGPQLLHIACPNGHELEVPPEMIGQDVMCPHCSAQFLLREKDSVESKRRKREELELKDFKAGKTWLMWAVIFTVLVLIGLVTMIAMSWEG